MNARRFIPLLLCRPVLQPMRQALKASGACAPASPHIYCNPKASSEPSARGVDAQVCVAPGTNHRSEVRRGLAEPTSPRRATWQCNGSPGMGILVGSCRRYAASPVTINVPGKPRRTPTAVCRRADQRRNEGRRRFGAAQHRLPSGRQAAWEGASSGGAAVPVACQCQPWTRSARR